MKKKINYQEIFTPQGLLGDVSKNPNMDFLMNIFKIPRIWGVSGFGEWNVGQHTMAVAYLTLYWSHFNKYPEEKRDKLVTLALVHDAHEAVIGDILPHFKTDEVKQTIDEIQNDILNSFSIKEDSELKKDIKLLDLISFLYEIRQSSVSGIDKRKERMLKLAYTKQKQIIMNYSKKIGLDEKHVMNFLKKIEI